MSLVASGIEVALDGRVILADASLTVRPGEIVGIVGPNGAGKSSLLRALAGQIPHGAGEVRAGGAPLAKIGARERATRIAFVAQENSVAADFTVRALAGMGRYAWRRRFAPETAEDRAVALEALHAVGIAGLADRELPSLSGGERQLARIAMALAQQAPVLLLDEPTSALDIHHRLRVFEILRDQAARGIAVAVVLHDLNDAARVCDRLVVVHGGTVRAAGTPREVLTEQLLAEVYRVHARVGVDSRDVVRVDPLRAFSEVFDAPPQPERTS